MARQRRSAEPRLPRLGVDVIGQPGKSQSRRRLRNRRDFAHWLAEVFDGPRIDKASIVGCSFGGFLALSQASLTPERVERAVLISPAGTFARMSWTVMALMLTARLRRRIRMLLGDRQPNVSALRDMGAPPRPEDGAWRSLMPVTMAESPEVFAIDVDVLSRREVRWIKAPTLLLIGGLERLYKPASTLRLARQRMPQLTAELVPGADHIAAMAQPEWDNARLLRFLNGEG